MLLFYITLVATEEGAWPVCVRLGSASAFNAWGYLWRLCTLQARLYMLANVSVDGGAKVVKSCNSY